MRFKLSSNRKGIILEGNEHTLEKQTYAFLMYCLDNLPNMEDVWNITELRLDVKREYSLKG